MTAEASEGQRKLKTRDLKAESHLFHFFLSVLSVSFDSLAPTRLTLRANLRLLYLKDPAFSIVVKYFRMIGSHKQPLQGAWGKCGAGCIKGDMAEARVAVTRCGINPDSVGGGGMALKEEVEAFERACGAGFDFNRNDA